MAETHVEARNAIRLRVGRRLREAGIDALVSYNPANVFYLSGYRSYFASEWARFYGCAVALLPADPGTPPGLMAPSVEEPPAREQSGWDDVRSFSMWIESRNLDVITRPLSAGESDITRPEWYDPDEQDAILREMLGDRGLLESRLAIEMDMVSAAFLERMHRLAPAAQWVDFSKEMFDMRAVKEPFEVDLLRATTELLEAGIVHARDRLAAGSTAAQARNLYLEGVLNAVAADPVGFAGFTDFWMITSVGSEGKIQVARGDTGMRAGDLVKFDGGATVGGYTGDGGRTFVFGRPSEPAARLHATLLEAFHKAQEMLRPGTRISDLFQSAQRHMNEHGYPRYRRGQFGHSLGIESFPEEPPYLSPYEHRLMEPGMVFALETPYYGSDVGSIMIEDLFVITECGYERLNRLPLDLVSLG